MFANRFMDAFAKSIFIFGVIHIAILIALAFRDGPDILNVFAILDIHAFVPRLGVGIQNLVFSFCFASAVYWLVFFGWAKGSRQNIEN